MAAPAPRVTGSAGFPARGRVRRAPRPGTETSSQRDASPFVGSGCWACPRTHYARVKGRKKAMAKQHEAENGHEEEVATYEQELAGYLQERIKPGPNSGAIPLLARSIAKAIAHREHPNGASADTQVEDEHCSSRARRRPTTAPRQRRPERQAPRQTTTTAPRQTTTDNAEADDDDSAESEALLPSLRGRHARAPGGSRR